MFLYVANGVTTIRAMLGAPNQLVLREQLKKGEVLGPTIFVAAPSLNGNSAPNPDTAMKLVRAHKSAGYDLVKLHPGLTRAVYDSAVKVAREVGITLGGHVSAQVGIDRTLEARQSTIDHLDGYIEGAVGDDLKRRIAVADRPGSAERVVGRGDGRQAPGARAPNARGGRVERADRVPVGEPVSVVRAGQRRGRARR